MSDNFNDENGQTPEPSFEDLLESYTAGMTDDVAEGDEITGKIISIGRDTLFVDTGTKIDGAVAKSEFLDENGEFPLEVGDTLTLYVVSSGENEIILSKAISGSGGLNILEGAKESGTPVEGKVTATVKGGFTVEIMKKRAFCPISQIDIKYVEDGETYVGQTLNFLVTRIEEKGRNIVVSRRQILDRELAVAREEFLGNLSEDAVVEGTVTKLMPFGAFVELLPGLEGMVHISELSWTRLEKAEDAVKPGDRINVKVIGVEQKEGAKSPRIGLSVKQVSANPWDLVGQNFHVGDNLNGKVMRCTGFGAFVEIGAGTEGLVHISEMSYTKRVLRPEEVVTVGETVNVIIKEIDLERKRISLSIRDALGDPWDLAGEKYAVGKKVSGTIERKESFGYFITLEPGITGLLPKSKISGAEDPSAIERLKIGATINVKVIDLNTDDRKVTLAPPEGDAGGDDWKQFSSGGEKSMGGFGELLQQALKSKK